MVSADDIAQQITLIETFPSPLELKENGSSACQIHSLSLAPAFFWCLSIGKFLGALKETFWSVSKHFKPQVPCQLRSIDFELQMFTVYVTGFPCILFSYISCQSSFYWCASIHIHAAYHPTSNLCWCHWLRRKKKKKKPTTSKTRPNDVTQKKKNRKSRWRLGENSAHKCHYLAGASTFCACWVLAKKRRGGWRVPARLMDNNSEASGGRDETEGERQKRAVIQWGSHTGTFAEELEKVSGGKTNQ